jgi:hypothetical protein|tara:strand:- start:228 stop:512 length:285 start_codon:yes stop_codon:yes gene_type:complete
MYQRNQQPARLENDKTFSFAEVDEDSQHLAWRNLPKYQDEMSPEDYEFMTTEYAALDGKLLFTTSAGVKVYMKATRVQGEQEAPGNLRAKYIKK